MFLLEHCSVSEVKIVFVCFILLLIAQKLLLIYEILKDVKAFSVGVRNNLLEVFYKKSILQKFRKIHRNTQNSQAFNFVKNVSPTQVFSCEFCKFSRTFFYRTAPVTTFVGSDFQPHFSFGKQLEKILQLEINLMSIFWYFLQKQRERNKQLKPVSTENQNNLKKQLRNKNKQTKSKQNKSEKTKHCILTHFINYIL